MKKRIIVVSLLVFICSLCVINYNKVGVKSFSVTNNSENFKIFLEYTTEEESDNVSYKLSSLDEVLKTNYVFNEELSKCENGGKVIFDKETKSFTYTVSLSDKCNVYFDLVKEEENVNEEESNESELENQEEEIVNE